MNKLTAIVISFGCASAILAPGTEVIAQTPAASIESALNRATELHRSGDVVSAIREYQAILARHPSRVDVRSNLGAAYAQLGRFQEAIIEYRRALAIDGRNSAIRFNLAVAFYKAADFTVAADELKQVITGDPDNLNAVLLLADCHLQLGEYQSVIELLSPMEARLTSDQAFAYILGTAFIKDKQFQRGQALIDHIMRSGDSAEVRLMIGTAHLMNRDYQNALKEFERALEMNPKLPTLNGLHGRALMVRGDSDLAMKAFQREIEVNPNDFDSHIYMGILLKKEAKNAEALEYLQRAAQVRPNDLTARYHIAALYLVTRKVAESVPLLEEVVKAAPEFVEARVLLAQAYYRLNRRAEGDRERAIIDKLNEEQQGRQPGVDPGDEEGNALEVRKRPSPPEDSRKP